jgi:ankyrin repeat protein
LLPNEAHAAAKAGELDKLRQQLDENANEVLSTRDENGWQVLHQASVGGNKEVVQLLVERGAEINARTHGGYGETPLRIAEKKYGAGHAVVDYLRSLGALSIGPEL